MREALARCDTLAGWSKRHDKPADYYKLRRRRWKDHPSHPFPDPVMGDQFDGVELAAWDHKRLSEPSNVRRKRRKKDTTR